MYPTLVRFGSFEITTFSLMMFLAFIGAGWVFQRCCPADKGAGFLQWLPHLTERLTAAGEVALSGQ